MEVVIAFIGMFGVLGAASIAAFTQVWLKRNVGTRNGGGTLVELVEEGLRWQGEHAEQDKRNFQAIAEHLGIKLPT